MNDKEKIPIKVGKNTYYIFRSKEEQDKGIKRLLLSESRNNGYFVKEVSQKEPDFAEAREKWINGKMKDEDYLVFVKKYADLPGKKDNE